MTAEDLYANFLETVEDKTIYGGDYACPFCMTQNHISRYLQTQKSGHLAKMMKCPVCHEEMRRDTLTMSIDTKEYAAWIYNYIRLGGYHKIHWDLLKDNLYKVGISQEFWKWWPIVKNEWKVKAGEITDDERNAEESEEAKAELIEYFNNMVAGQHCKKEINLCLYNAVDDAYNTANCMCNCNKCIMGRLMSSRAKERRKANE